MVRSLSSIQASLCSAHALGSAGKEADTNCGSAERVRNCSCDGKRASSEHAEGHIQLSTIHNNNMRGVVAPELFAHYAICKYSYITLASSGRLILDHQQVAIY
jgi:hypothetical protein